MSLNNKDKLNLIKKAHKLKPLIMIGQKGVTQSLIDETDRALFDHELIKIKVSAESKSDIVESIESICNSLNAENLKIIGKIAIVYRKSDKDEIKEQEKEKSKKRKRK